MLIIPVIDLMNGQVVHAVRGNRAEYAPIHLHSKLVKSSQIDEVIATFLKLCSFPIFYLADLNAITCNLHHHEQISAIVQKYEHIRFWVDNGSQLSNLTTSKYANYHPVIGTESQIAPPEHQHPDGNPKFILSLDYQQEQPAGHPAWFENTAFWPKDVIVMTLNRVGSNTGPDFTKLAELTRNNPDKTVIAAGGIRDTQDLHQLSQIGVNTALIATALHQGKISIDDIVNLKAKKYPG